MSTSEQHSVAGALTPEQRRIATQQYERARQVINTGNFDYGIELLRTCCKLDPSNLIYRQMLRATQKVKFKNNLRGSLFAVVTNAPVKTKLRVAVQTRQYHKALEHGEVALSRNPWDSRVQLLMAEAADKLGLLDVAIWLLEAARQKNPKDRRVNRPLAQLYEKRGSFTQAVAMYDLVAKANPKDYEAARKTKDLAATHTINRGHYGEAASGQQAPSFREPEPDQEAKPSAADKQTARKIELIRTKINGDPSNPNHYLQLAALQRREGHLEQARKVLQEGLVPTKQHFELQTELADLEIEPFRQNLHVAEDQLKDEPQDLELKKLRIRLLKEINTREMDLFRQKAERFPLELGPRLELGIRLLRAGQSQEAIQELQEARRDPRLRWKALLYLGHCFKSKNNWHLARRNFEEALQTLPPEEEQTRKELLFQLAAGAAEEKDWRTALDVGNELANLEFGYRDIGRLLDEWQARKVAGSS